MPAGCARSPRRTGATGCGWTDGPDEVHRNQIGKLELRKYD